MPRITYENGDQADYLDLTFRCEWVSGDPYPADGELSEVGWYDLDALPPMAADMRRRIVSALSEDDPARFEGGR